MGLEEHLLTMFREDFEFSDEAGASHHAAHSPKQAEGHKQAPHAGSQAGPETGPETPPSPHPANDAWANGAGANGGVSESGAITILWTDEAERELKKFPFFVRGKARRNTEAFAADQGRPQIDLETLYDAKAHYAR